METIIKCSNLTHYYGSRKIYEDLNFEVPKGRILGLLGKNGTGKTTTINILMGYLKPRSGECRIFGEDIQRMQPVTRERIALLIENHVQYTFMNIEQIERFYSAFYPKWNKEAYYELMRKLKVAPKQKISRMSCGQRSHPGYRRLFTEYLREYAKAEEKTIFLTSHIIQDMERLVDDCIIMDYGRILIQKPVKELLDTFTRYTFKTSSPDKLPHDPSLYSTAAIRDSAETYSFENEERIKQILQEQSIPYTDFKSEKMNLEDVFIGLTGKY